MNKNRMITLLLLIFIVFSLPVCAAESSQANYEKGKPGTIWGIMASNVPVEYETNFSTSYILNSEDIIDKGPQSVAKTLVAFMKKQPEGRRCLEFGAQTALLMCNYAENYIWWENGVEYAKEILEPVWAFYKAYGGPDIDIIYADFEHSCTIGTTERADAIVNDERYYSEIRVPLEKAGFVFCEDENKNELQDVLDNYYPTRQQVIDGDPIALSATALAALLARRTKEYFIEAYVNPAKKYFPNVKIANYDYNVVPEGSKALTQHGYRMDDGEKNILVGTHSSGVLYGAVIRDHAVYIKQWYPDYPYDNFPATPYNSTLATVIWGQELAKAGPSMPWIAGKNYSAADLRTTNTGDEINAEFQCNNGHTDQYNEMVLHLGLCEPDPFLCWFWLTRPEYIEEANGLFNEINELVGFPDRQMIENVGAAWNKRYVLTGMTANGNNVWRITPDESIPGLTHKTFLKDKENLIFQAGQDVIDFPEGSFIYTPEKSYGPLGYWVISPEGTYPKEYKDTNTALPPISSFDYLSFRRSLPGGVSQGINPVGVTVNIPKAETDVEKANANLARTELDLNGIEIAFTDTVFLDISGHWAQKTIESLYEKNIVKGDGKFFYPDNEVKKAEFLAMVLRILDASNTFTGSEWVDAVKNKSIEYGFMEEGDLLSASDIIKRGEMAVILDKIFNKESSEEKETVSDAQSAETLIFTDEADIDETILPSIKRVYHLDIIKGYPDGSYRPESILSRAEAASVMERVIKELSK